MTQDFIHDAKRKNIPAPGVYSLPKQEKFVLGFSEKSEKYSYNIDAAIWKAKQTPTVCYKDPKSLENLIKPKIFTAKIFEQKNKGEDLVSFKIKKADGPDMGTYDVNKGHDY